MRVKSSVIDNNRLYTVAFSAGVIGALIMTVIVALARGFDLTALNFEMVLGSLLTATTGAGTWLVGFVWHLINGGIFGLIYAAGFQAVGRMDTGTGIGFGLIHWVVGGILVGLVSFIHPLMPDLMTTPGYFVVNGGVIDMASFFVLHLIFGGIVGAICQRKAGLSVVRRTDTDFDTERNRAA